MSIPQSLQSTSRESGPLMTGAVVSTTVMVWMWARLFPAQSIVLQVRVRVCPSAQSPAVDPSLKVTSTSPSQLSVAMSVAAAGMASQDTVVSAGSSVVHAGAVSSTTVSVCSWVVLLPQSSVAVQLRRRV